MEGLDMIVKGCSTMVILDKENKAHQHPMGVQRIVDIWLEAAEGKEVRDLSRYGFDQIKLYNNAAYYPSKIQMIERDEKEIYHHNHRDNTTTVLKFTSNFRAKRFWKKFKREVSATCSNYALEVIQ